MSFELSPDLLDGELAFQFSEIGSDFVVQIPIGFDQDDERVFSLFVALSPPVGAIEGEFELIFCLIDTDERSGEEIGRIWDGLHTRRVVAEPEHRTLILDAAFVAIVFLIEQISPSIVHMVTHTPDLPEKALLKFNRIATLFSQNGYRSGQCDRYHGQRIWIMHRM